MNKYGYDNFGLSESTLSLITTLRKNHEITLVLFGSPYSLRNFTHEEALIVAYEVDFDAQRAAAKVVLGKLKPQGKLPVTASEFKIGDGL